MNPIDSYLPRALVVLSEKEREDFLPEPLRSALNELLPDAVWVEAPVAGEAWDSLLKTHRPEIIVCAWDTSCIPAEALPDLKYVCYLCGSVRSLVSRDMINEGLLVTNWGRVISNTVAECALLFILASLRRLSNWTLEMHVQGGWKKDRHVDSLSLFHRRVGIHGFGAIARELIKLLAPFKVDISVYSPGTADEDFDANGVRRAETLEELFSNADVLVELAPGIPENHHIVSEELLRLLPDRAVFVNIGRGMLVDEKVLVRVAKEKQLHLALDVFETEPLPKDSPLRGLPNTTLFPHLGGPTRDRRIDCGGLAVENIGKYLRGEPLEHLIDLEIYDRAT